MCLCKCLVEVDCKSFRVNTCQFAFHNSFDSHKIGEGNKPNQRNWLSWSTHHYTGKSLQPLLVSQDCSVLLTYVLIILLIASCLLVCCSLAIETAQVCVFCVLQLVEYQYPALCAKSTQWTRFRKITRGEWLTQSSCYVTKGSYQITVDSRLGDTVAVFRSLWLEQTRNWN